MNVIEVKTNIHQLIEQVQDNDFLVKVKRILENFVADESIIWDDLTDELELKLKNAEKDSTENHTTPHEEVASKFRKQYAHFYGN